LKRHCSAISASKGLGGKIFQAGYSLATMHEPKNNECSSQKPHTLNRRTLTMRQNTVSHQLGNSSIVSHLGWYYVTCVRTAWVVPSMAGLS